MMFQTSILQLFDFLHVPIRVVRTTYVNEWERLLAGSEKLARRPALKVSKTKGHEPNTTILITNLSIE